MGGPGYYLQDGRRPARREQSALGGGIAELVKMAVGQSQRIGIESEMQWEVPWGGIRCRALKRHLSSTRKGWNSDRGGMTDIPGRGFGDTDPA